MLLLSTPLLPLLSLPGVQLLLLRSPSLPSLPLRSPSLPSLSLQEALLLLLLLRRKVAVVHCLLSLVLAVAKPSGKLCVLGFRLLPPKSIARHWKACVRWRVCNEVKGMTWSRHTITKG